MATESSRPLSRRLRSRLRLYALIALALLIVTVVTVVRGRIGPPLAAAGLGGGLAGGLLLARMFDIAWDEEGEQVVARIDWLGGAILVLYLAYVVLRERVLGFWATGPTLGALTVAVTAGVMLGRVLGTARGTQRVLQALGPSGEGTAG